MRYLLVAGFTLFASFDLFSQINLADSSSQVIGYWWIDDAQSYDISFEKYKVKENDTIGRTMIRYEVDVTVKDSTKNSYTIEWFYKNYEIDSDNELALKILKAAEDVSVIIKTNEYGEILEVVNWKEVRAHVQKTVDIIRKEYKKVPEVEQMLAQSMGIYSSKAAIEANAIKDAIQFYSFHGGVYTLHEQVTGQVQFANNYGGDPFDVDVSLSLDEIDEEYDASLIRMYQSVDSEQLTAASYAFLKKTGAFGDDLPPIEEFPTLSNETWTASWIHGNTGWPTYSIETKEISAEGTTNVEERIIQLK